MFIIIIVGNKRLLYIVNDLIDWKCLIKNIFKNDKIILLLGDIL